ncbi:hypothetical protein D3C81_1312080 [compost metagenome]
MDLHRAVSHPAAHFGGEQLAARRFRRNVFLVVAPARRVEHHAARRVNLGLAVGQHGLDQLEFGDGLAELLAFHGVCQGVGQHAFGRAHADGGDVQAALVEHFHGCFKPHALLAADDVRGRDTAVFKDHVAGMRTLLAHLLVYFPQREARRILFHDEGGNGRGTPLDGVRARHDGKNARFGRVGDIALAAVEDIEVAVAHGRSAQRGRIRS